MQDALYNINETSENFTGNNLLINQIKLLGCVMI